MYPADFNSLGANSIFNPDTGGCKLDTNKPVSIAKPIGVDVMTAGT